MPDSWEAAIEGSNYVVHTASPFVMDQKKATEDQLVKPAVEGTLAVLKAAVKAGVKKIVLTSSIAAI